LQKLVPEKKAVYALPFVYNTGALQIPYKCFFSPEKHTLLTLSHQIAVDHDDDELNCNVIKLYMHHINSFFCFQCLNKATIPKISARIVCGAANNQLGCDTDNELLADRGITYVVDFLANRMVSWCSSFIIYHSSFIIYHLFIIYNYHH
jgi:hypothetical protein